MSTNHTDKGAVQTYAGGAVPTSYSASASNFQIDAAQDGVLWVKFTWDAATNFTTYSFKLQISYDGTNFVDTQTVRSSTGVASAEHSVAAAAGTTTWVAFQTSDNRLSIGGCRIQIKGNGGAVKSGDAAIIYCTAW